LIRSNLRWNRQHLSRITHHPVKNFLDKVCLRASFLA